MKYLDDLLVIIGIFLIVMTTFRINEYVGWYLVSFISIFLGVILAKNDRKTE